jgi:hypothetical protein
MTGLAQYNPLWQPVRATGEPTRVYEDDQVLIATDFEGGNGAHIRRLGSGEYAVTLEPEPGEHRFSGRSYYYCVGVRSKRPAASTVRLRLEGHAHGTESFGRDVRHAVLRRGGTWSHLDPSAIRSLGDDALTLDLPLPAADEPDPVLFVSDFHWWPYSEVIEYVRSLRGVKGVAVREIGRSALGRPLMAVEVGPPGAPCMVHAATPQASEMGHLACRAMIDYVTSPDPEAAAIREGFRLSFIPVTNPDGLALGYGVSDGQGRFPFFEAHLAATGDPAAGPETVAVWRYLEAQRPWLFWDWHSNNWHRRLGHILIRYRHTLLEDAARRRLWGEVEDRLLALPDTHHENWTSHDEGPYQPPMGFQAVTRLGAIACMIKQHDRFPLEASRRHAVACLRAAAAAYRAQQGT